jgi:hypothetical protein
MNFLVADTGFGVPYCMGEHLRNVRRIGFYSFFPWQCQFEGTVGPANSFYRSASLQHACRNAVLDQRWEFNKNWLSPTCTETMSCKLQKS